MVNTYNTKRGVNKIAVVYMRKLELEPETYESQFTVLTKGTNIKVHDWILQKIKAPQVILDFQASYQTGV